MGVGICVVANNVPLHMTLVLEHDTISYVNIEHRLHTGDVRC